MGTASSKNNSGCGLVIVAVLVLGLALAVLKAIWWLLLILAVAAAVGAYFVRKRASKRGAAKEDAEPRYSQRCPNCSAQASVSVYDSHAECSYCGSSFPAEREPLSKVQPEQGSRAFLSDPFKLLVAVAAVLAVLGLVGLGFSISSDTSSSSSSNGTGTSGHASLEESDPDGRLSASSADAQSSGDAENAPKAVPTVELNDLQKAFCELSATTTKGDIDALISDRQFEVNKIGQSEETYCIGYEHQAVTQRGRDREGEALDITFTDDGAIESADYAMHVGFDTNYALEYRSGSFYFEGKKARDAEDAMQDYLASVGYGQ